MVSLAMSCVKYLLFAFNLLFAIIGITIVVGGALLQSVYHNYSSFTNENFKFLPICIMVTGVVIFVIAFFGCCGTVKENLCMVSTFASLMITIFIIELVAGIGTFVFKNDIKDIVADKMNSSLQFYETDAEVTRSWDILQTDLHCCGVNGSMDWKDKIPPSCCKDIRQDEQCTEKDAYEIGCLEKMSSFTGSDALIFVLCVIGLALIQLLGVGFSCCLAHSIHKGYETV